MRCLRPLFLGLLLVLPAGPLFAADACCRCTKPGDSDTICVTQTYSENARSAAETCTNLPQSAKLDNWRCEVLPDTQCKPVGTGAGICQQGPTSSLETQKKEEEAREGDIVSIGGTVAKESPAILPNLNVPIPGFSFIGGGGVTEDTSSLLAQYIAGLYRYGISITAVAATIMFVWGAFRYLIGSGLGSVQRGKAIMQEAILGMLLVLGANLILRTINPATLTFEALYIKGVNPLELGQYNEFVRIQDETVPNNIAIPSLAKEYIAQEIIAGVKDVSGADPCVILAICQHETGLRPLWNGIQSGTPKEEAIAFGPCQAVTQFLHDKNPIAQRTAAAFPDFPLLPKTAMSQGGKLVVGDWLLQNPRGAGFVAALTLNANISQFRGNEITALGGYGAGAQSIRNWQKAHHCTPTAGVRVAGANAASIAEACLPHSVGIPGKAEGAGCPEDGWECANPKSDSKARLVGTCSDGRQCYAMITDTFAQYVLRNYSQMIRNYKCNQ